MRLLKAQNTNQRSIKGKGVKYAVDDRVTVDSTKSLAVPVGTETERPATPDNGYLRYNTTSSEFEFYSDNAWRKVRYKEPIRIGITQQNLGNGDGIETVFGPLQSDDPDYPVPASAESILVFVENVFQLASTNYTLVTNPSGFVDGTYIEFTSAPPQDKPVAAVHNLDK